MSRAPLVSVVVPTYDNAPFVEATLRSVLAQTLTDLEVVVSDHGSTDGTWERVRAFADDPRVRLLRLPRSGDPCDNWAHATQAARGRYVKLLCGDDLLAPHCLEQQVAALEAHPDAVLVASRRDVVTARGDVVLRAWGLPGMTGELPGAEAVRLAVRSGTNTFGEPGCVLLRRDVLDAVGGWDATYPYVVDQHTYAKVLRHGSFVGLAEPLASFRLSEGQWSVSLARSQYGQVVAFHRSLARAVPGLLSGADLRRGRRRARFLALARRLAYLSLSRRLRTVPPVPAGIPAPAAVPPVGRAA